MNRLIVVSPAAAAVLAAAGCNGGATGASIPLTVASDPGGIEAHASGAALAASVERSVAAYEPEDSGAGFTTPAACVTLGGSLVDSDLDDFPDVSLTLTLANCTVSGTAGTITVDGTVTTLDTALGSQTLDFTRTVALTAHAVAGPLTADSTIDGTETGVSSGMPTLSTSAHVVTDVEPSARHLVEDVDWSTQYAPSVTWSPGAALVGGTIAFQGNWSMNADGRVLQATVTTPAPLTVAPTGECATRVTAGSLQAEYTAAGEVYDVEVAWGGCGVRTVTWVTPQGST